MDRVALYLQDSHDLRDGLEYARYAEERGFEAVWQAESRLVRDAIVPMAAYAAVTDKIDVVSKGLGEMTALATDVGDLKKVMSNIKNIENALKQSVHL